MHWNNQSARLADRLLDIALNAIFGGGDSGPLGFLSAFFGGGGGGKAAMKAAALNTGGGLAGLLGSGRRKAGLNLAGVPATGGLGRAAFAAGLPPTLKMPALPGPQIPRIMAPPARLKSEIHVHNNVGANVQVQEGVDGRGQSRVDL